MAANMYRVGGMYTNVDFFIRQKPFQFCILRVLCCVIVVSLRLILRCNCATLTEMQ